MEQIADRLSEKLHTLTRGQLAEVERFVESLQGWERDRGMTQSLSRSSEPLFAAVWSNPEDDAYDAL